MYLIREWLDSSGVSKKPRPTGDISEFLVKNQTLFEVLKNFAKGPREVKMLTVNALEIY